MGYFIVILFLIITASILAIARLDFRNKNLLINKIADVNEETRIWKDKKIKNKIKEENLFLNKFFSMEFKEEELKVENYSNKKKFFVPYSDLIKVEKIYDGNKYILNNGMEIFDNYYLDIYYNEQNKTKKERICIEKNNKNSKVKLISKIKYNTYLDILEEKINELSDNQLIV